MSGVRRLSPLDAAFLYWEKPHQRLHVGCVALLDGPLDFAAFVAAMEERLGTIPRYRQRPVRPLLDLDWPRWVEDPDFDVRRHLRHVALPAPGGDAELHAMVDSLFAIPLDDAHPLWEDYLIDGLAGGRSALLCKVHHAMIDGVSGAQVLEVMADPPAGGRGNGRTIAGQGTPPNPTRTPVRLSALRAALAAASPAALLDGARNALAGAGTLASLLIEPISPLPFNGRLTDARRIVWASFPLDDFFAMRGAHGCKVNDVVLAVITGALRRYLLARGVRLEGMRVRTMVPVSVRRPDDHLTLGNLVSSMFPRLPLDVADPLERLQRITDELRSLKDRGQARAAGLAMAVAGALPAPVGALLGRLMVDVTPINTVCTNVPGPREACQLLGRRILEVHPIVPLFQPMGMEFAILSYAGRLSISAAVDPHLVPDADTIPGHLEAAAAELRDRLVVPQAAPSRTAARGVTVVADLMSRTVTTLAPTDSLAKAWGIMRFGRIRHLPVVDRAQRLVGLLTHRDLLAASTSSLALPAEDDRVRLLGWHRVMEVMETHLATAAPEESAAEAGERLVRHKIGCLPVIGRDGRLVGIVTESDFLRWATEHMAAPEPVRASA
jgi:WS/DGAT/MGAT family acyltransferase